jgi:hypothetical protein
MLLEFVWCPYYEAPSPFLPLEKRLSICGELWVSPCRKLGPGCQAVTENKKEIHGYNNNKERKNNNNAVDDKE